MEAMVDILLLLEPDPDTLIGLTGCWCGYPAQADVTSSGGVAMDVTSEGFSIAPFARKPPLEPAPGTGMSMGTAGARLCLISCRNDSITLNNSVWFTAPFWS